MTIDPGNEARLTLANTGDQANALCILTCWAGPVLAGDIRTETDPATGAVTFVVDKTWCDLGGPLSFDGGATMLCPLADTQTVNTVSACAADTCTTGAVFVVDRTQSPVITVTVTGPSDSDMYAVHWGPPYVVTKDVKPGDPVSTTYTVPGTYAIRVQDEATGQYGHPITVNVTQPPHSLDVECLGDQTAVVGRPVSLRAVADSNNPAVSYTWTATGLPSGVSMTNVGGGVALFTGTPTVKQTANVVLVASNGMGNTVTCRLTWTVVDHMNTVTVTKPDDQTNTVGDTVSLQLAATDSDPSITAFTWSAAGLPAGLSLNKTTGKITGKPDTAQSAGDVTATAADATGATGQTVFSWTVNPETTTVTVADPGAQSNGIGDTVSLQVEATDSDPSITTFTWSATGLPDGLSINATTGKITGKPTKGQKAADVTVTATDKNKASGSKTFTWTIATTVTVAAIDDQTFTAGTAITAVTPSATDSDGSITTFAWSVDPALPASLKLDGKTGKISGTPDAAQEKTKYTLTATDSLDAAGTGTVNITVDAS